MHGLLLQFRLVLSSPLGAPDASNPCSNPGLIRIDMLKYGVVDSGKSTHAFQPSVSADDESCTISRFFFRGEERYQGTRVPWPMGKGMEGEKGKGVWKMVSFQANTTVTWP